MAFTEVLRLVINADTHGAVQGIKGLGDTADRELGRSEKSLDKWGNRLTTVGAGMIAFGAAAVVGLGALAKESEQANLAQVKLQNTIDNMPKLAGATAKEFTDLADSIQDVTAADADAIVEAEALLGTFNLTASEIKNITPLVVDYARKFGVDMADAAVQVGKALDGQVGALKRNGVSIDETLFKTDRYRAVQEALSNQVGGFAEAEGKTFAGSLERLKNELGDLAEGVGGGAVDAFTTMFGAVDKVAGAFESISPGAQNLIGQIATFGAVALIAVGGVSTLIGQVIKARESFVAAAAAMRAYSAAFITVGQVGAVVGILVGLREVLGTLGDELNRADLSKLENQLLDLAQTGKVSGDVLSKVFKDIFAGGGLEDLSQGRKALDDLDQALAKLAARDPEAAAEAFKQISERAQEAGLSASQVKDAFGEYNTAIAEADTVNRTTGAAIDEATGAIDDQSASADEATASVQTYSDTLKGLFDPLFAAVNGQRQLEDANADVTAAELTLAGAIQEHGADSLEAMAATDELRDAQLRAAEAGIRQAGTLDDLRRGLQDGSIDIDEARRRLDEFVFSGQVSAEAAAGFRAELDRLDGKVVNVSIVTTRSEVILSGSRNVPLGRQHGGPVQAGQPYIVGEHHAELFVPERNGMVLPSVPGSSATHTSFGGGGTVTIKFDSGSNPIDQLFMDIIRRNVRIQHGGNVQAAIGFNR